MPNTTDSLLHIIDSARINYLNHLIYHLTQKVNDTKISEGYFTALLSIQTGIFLAVIGIAAFIAWSNIVKGIKESHNKILAKNSTFQKGVTDKIDMFNGELSSQLVEMREESFYNQELLYRSMYISADANKSYLACFFWSIRSIHLILEKDIITDKDMLKTMLYTQGVEQALKKVIDNNKIMDADDLAEMIKRLEFCIAYKQGKFKEKCQNILNDLNKYYYTNLPTSSEPIVPIEPAN